MHACTAHLLYWNPLTSPSPPGEEEGEERGEEYGSEGYQGPCLKGPQLWLTQALALAVKRGLYTYRRSLAYTVQTVLPLLLIILGLGISNQLQVHLEQVHKHHTLLLQQLRNFN